MTKISTMTIGCLFLLIFSCGEKETSTTRGDRLQQQSGEIGDLDAEGQKNSGSQAQQPVGSGEVNTTPQAEVIPSVDPVEFEITFPVNGEAVADIDSSFSIKWTVTNAKSCVLIQKSQDAGEQDITLEEMATEGTVDITASIQDMQFLLDCVDLADNKVTESFEVQTKGQRVIANTPNPFTVLGVLIDQGVFTQAGAFGAAVQNDPETANQVCKLLKYDIANSITNLYPTGGNSRGWFSPFDNFMIRWDAATGTFVKYAYPDFANQWISSITCVKN